MNCSDAEILITGLADGELEHAQLREVQSHLSSCASCERQLEEERALKEAVARMPVPAMPVELRGRLERIAARGPAQAPRVLRFSATVAGVLIVVGVLALLQIGPARPVEASDFVSLHTEAQAPTAQYCPCCPSFDMAIGQHAQGTRLVVGPGIDFKGYKQHESDRLGGTVSRFAATTDFGPLTIFLLDKKPDLDHVTQAGSRSLLVVPDGERTQLWVGTMRKRDLLAIASAR